MKYIFKFLFLVPMISNAGRLNIQYHSKQMDKAILARDILNQRYNIPHKLIKIQQSNKCLKSDQLILDFCISSTGDLDLVPNVNRELIMSSLNIFYKGSSNGN